MHTPTQINTRPRLKYAESPLSDYVSDAWRNYTIRTINLEKPNPAMRATIGITQLGGIRSDLTQGVLTYADALRVLPFGNLLWVKDFPAKILLEAYQHGITSEKWLKTSGRIRVYQTLAGGATTLKSLWVLFDGDTAYTQITSTSEEIIRIATTDYLIQGGNGYTMLTTTGTDVLDGPGDNVADIFAKQMRLDYESPSGGTNFQIDPNDPRIIQCENVNCGGVVDSLRQPCCAA